MKFASGYIAEANDIYEITVCFMFPIDYQHLRLMHHVCYILFS